MNNRLQPYMFDILYIVFKDGTVYVQKTQDSELELFLDLTEVVHTEFQECQGLYDSLNSGKSFLVSYSNQDIALVFENTTLATIPRYIIQKNF